MAVSGAEFFKKQTVTRPAVTSILTSLLSSTHTACSSSDLLSTCDVFSECNLTSRSENSSPRTPPRKSCLSFAAVPPKSPLANLGNTATQSKDQSLSLSKHPPVVLATYPKDDNAARVESAYNARHRTMLGSVFDEFGEGNSSPVFHDYYRIGQPKKLVDDCLRKEKELRISPAQEDEDRDDADREAECISEGDDDDEEEEIFCGDDGDSVEDETEDEPDDPDLGSKSGRDYSAKRSHLRINIGMVHRIVSPSAVYMPSRDVDNFVPGTLDEDQLEAIMPTHSPPSPHDIDPTYPSDEEEDLEGPSRSGPPPASPVRFLAKHKLLIQPIKSPFHSRSSGLNRTHSLPWGCKRYNANLKLPVTKSNYHDQPRCAAIAIVKAVEYKRHHRREKKEDADHCNEGKGFGVEAMAAMARRLTTKHTLRLWAVSI